MTTNASDELIYRHRTYVPLIGSTFEVERGEDDRVSIELVDVTVLHGRGEAFSLVFRGAAVVPLDQCTYLVEHRTLGEFPLFLVPLGPNANGAQEFEAVVNRLEGAET
jgi:hypothetical protein